MEIPLIDANSIFARLRAPGLIAIAIAAFLAFASLARRTVHLILNRAKGISVISNQAAAAVFSGDWSDTESEIGSASEESESDASFSDEEDDMDTHGDNCSDGGYRSSHGQYGNFDLSWGGTVVKTWEGLGLFGSCSNQPASMDNVDDGENDTSEMASVVRYWDDISIRPKWRRRRSFVMMDLW